MSEESRTKYNFSAPVASSPPEATEASGVGHTPAVTSVAAPVEEPSMGLLAGAVPASLFAGIACGWLYALFVSLTGFGLAILTSAIGWVIGVVMVAVGRRNGILPAALSVAVAIVALTLSRYFLVQFDLDKMVNAGQLPERVRAAFASDPVGWTLKSFGWSPMSVIILLIGVWGAWKVPAGGVAR